ncbi:MAG: nuclear transport factor 2 family protein [Deltaproteobacteria bacterium]|nr:nuclear transport factor 2 family protein [Deltaproteobacteria bacterium]
MPASIPTRAELEALVLAFTDAFNREDLDAVMTCMTDDAIYDQFNGVCAVGKAAIREAFVPQFRGDFGTIRFVTEDCFVDAAAGKAMIRWACTLEHEGVKRRWRGLDLLHFDGRLMKEKHTYAKTDALLLQPFD